MLKRNVIPPKSGHARQMIVLIHGYTGDMQSMAGLARRWQDDFPDAVFVLPQAPDATGENQKGYKWFSVGACAEASLVRRDFHAAQVSPRLNACIDEEMKNWNIPDDKVALLGFSQGAMMALHAGPRRATPVAAIAAFSGRLLGAAGLARPDITKPPILIVHGEKDDVVPTSYMDEAVQILRANAFKVTTLARPNLAHVMDKAGLDNARDFIAGKLGVKPPAPPQAGISKSRFFNKGR